MTQDAHASKFPPARCNLYPHVAAPIRRWTRRNAIHTFARANTSSYGDFPCFSLFPVSGYGGPGSSFLERMYHLTLPAFALGIVSSALILRFTRASMLDVPYTGLGPFFARGGRLMLSHGWTDGLIPPQNTIDFYSALYPTLNDAQQQGQLEVVQARAKARCRRSLHRYNSRFLGEADRLVRQRDTPRPSPR